MVVDADTPERVLVAVSSSRGGAELIRAAARISGAPGAVLLAVHVETPAGSHLGRRDIAQLLANLNLAESLGAEAATVHGENVAGALLSFAREHQVRMIVIGRGAAARRAAWRRRSVTDELIEGCDGMQVTVVATGSRDASRQQNHAQPTGSLRRPLRSYGYAVLLMAGATGVALALGAAGLSKTDAVMAYLLGIVCVAFFFGRGPDIVATVLSVLSFNFFFTEPYYTLAVNDPSYIFTFVTMLVVGVIVSELANRIRRQTEAARQREQRTESLYRLSKRLSRITGVTEIVRAAEDELARLFRMPVQIALPTGDGAPAGDGQDGGGSPRRLLDDPLEQHAARWVLANGRVAGRGTEDFGESRCLFLPLRGPHGVVGALAADPSSGSLFRLPDLRSSLETFCGLISFAIDRERLSEESNLATRRMEAERTRGALLSSLSHDLRTPIASIAGASSSLMELYGQEDEATRRSLISSISEEAGWLSRMVENLLSMTRLQAEPLAINRQLEPIEEVIGAALARLGKASARHPVRVAMPEEMCLVSIDDLLIEQALINLVDNADKYSAEGTPIDVRVRTEGPEVMVEVCDRGMGIPEAGATRLFEKFYRDPRAAASGVRGAGLGLSICKAVVEAHGGRIWASPREGGGSVFTLALPRVADPQELEADG